MAKVNIFTAAEDTFGGPSLALVALNEAIPREKPFKSNYWYRWRKGSQRAPVEVKEFLQATLVRNHFPEQADQLIMMLCEDGID